MKRLFNFLRGNLYVAVVINLLLAMALYSICRLEFYLVNESDFFPDLNTATLPTIFAGGLKFDLTAVLYTNMLYLLLMLIPFRFRLNTTYQSVARWIFIVVNAIGVVINLGDSIYFKFTSRRTTMSFFQEFENDNNLGGIVADGALNYWYVVLTGVALIAALVLLYHNPVGHANQVSRRTTKASAAYYVRNVIALLVAVFFIVNGMRGGFGSFVRPITLSNANQYVTKPLEASIVLNTPFCLIRTIGKHPYKDPHYFDDKARLEALYSPLHQMDGVQTEPMNKKNVVIFILESFSKEFVGELNKDLDNGTYKGYTPFLDSLIRESLTFEYSFANGRKSIDAMPSVLSSIPRFYEPYFLTSYSNNRVSGIADVLNGEGYYTAFFHGAPNGSMGFEAFANVSGFQDYYGKTEYDAAHPGNDDYDGHWGIWDEEFFQFFGQTLSTFQQPFMTALFSVSSHHPFHVPARYADVFVEEGGHPLHKCIRYSDNALRRFFDYARQQPWYANTIFVITADHTNALTRKEYLTDAGYFKVPIVFFTPDGSLRGRVADIASQADIMPTVLAHLNYRKPYFAYGNNLLDSTYTRHYAINHFDQTFQLFEDSLLVQFDGERVTGVYNFVEDVFQKHNLSNDNFDTTYRQQIKAIVQQYIDRMTSNRMTVEDNQ